MLREPKLILEEELREPETYFQILEAISLGYTKVVEIETWEIAGAWSDFERDFYLYLGFTVEKIARELLLEKKPLNNLVIGAWNFYCAIQIFKILCIQEQINRGRRFRIRNEG